MKKIISLLLIFAMMFSLCACAGGSGSEVDFEVATTTVQTKPFETEPAVDPKIQEFAEKFFVAGVEGADFINPLSIEVKNAWWRKFGSEDYWAFTFEFTIENSSGIRQKVFYGNDFVLYGLTDKTLEQTRDGAWGSFDEGDIGAMQEGEPLDAEAIQQYFMRNYR